MKIPEARIIIIEGVAGSGKDSLQKFLKEKLAGKNVYDYPEENILFSWKHAKLKNIAKLRIKLINSFLDFVETAMNEDPEGIFILNRFHLSLYMANVSKEKTLLKDYRKIVLRLKKLPVHIILLLLSEEQIKKRSSHKERSKKWKEYQKKAIKEEGFKNIIERYLNEQKLMIEAIEKDGIPYSLEHM